MASEEVLNRVENTKYILELEYDKGAEDPFQYDERFSFFRIIAFHKSYSIGYDHGCENQEEYLRSLLKTLYTEEYIDRTLKKLRQATEGLPHVYYEKIIYTFKRLSKKYAFFNLYFLDNKIFYLSLQPFESQENSGTLGWIVVNREKMKEANIKNDKLKEFIEDCLKTYNNYLNGYVYALILKEKIPVASDNPGHQGLYAEYLIDMWGGIYGFNELELLKSELPEEVYPLLDKMIKDCC